MKLFLPVIEKANKELEETIRLHGAEAVRIDTTMVDTAAIPPAGIEEIDESTASKCVVDGVEERMVEEDESSASGESEDEEDAGAPAAASATEKKKRKVKTLPPREIQLEFAIGDFDGTPLAVIDQLDSAEEEVDSDEV